MVLIRNILFMLALAVFTPLYALIGMASFPFGPKTRHKLIRGWPRIMAWVIKHVLGIPYRLIGSENIPAGPAIVVSKHMSAWETIMPVSYTHLDVYKRQAEALFYTSTVAGAKLADVLGGIVQDALKQLCLLYTSRCV